MSTFDGIVVEFPEIRIDYFRTIPGRVPPLACFLSHVHSDHLQGLESLKSPFVYCSPATRELLLRLEKYPHRMNFAKGILETRKQHYKGLKRLLKPIPLNAPTDIELAPGKAIRVTLLDANHCAGAVMFLVEDSKNAILYTGDIRSELWWVNQLTRNPVLAPFTYGSRRIDMLYLDTTFATKRKPYNTFPTKAEGLRDLISEVLKYPRLTKFHFHAWTFGYEDVWVALSSALRSRVHVDQYKYDLYNALSTSPNTTVLIPEGPALCGFVCGNRHQPGCLTEDTDVKIHSCERGIHCESLKSKDTVWIRPIITRTQSGETVPELGAGGGGGDLLQNHELELNDVTATVELMKLCSEKIQDPMARSRTLALISKAVSSRSKALSLAAIEFADKQGEMSLEEVTHLLERAAKRKLDRGDGSSEQRSNLTPDTSRVYHVQSQVQSLPRSITFPYSRHSSYEELCHLVGVLRPLDVYPCTVDEHNWTMEASIKELFGHLCSGQNFAHDQRMIALMEARGSGDAKKRSFEAIDDGSSALSSSQRSRREDEEDDLDETALLQDFNTPRHQPRTTSSHSQDDRDYVPLRASLQQTVQVRIHQKSSSMSDASIDTSLDRRIKAIKRSFDNGWQQRVSLSDSSSQPFVRSNQVGVETQGAHVDERDDESQVSLPSSAFDSQGSTADESPESKTKTLDRKEAYKAALGIHGRSWTSSSPISSSYAAYDDKVELG